MHSKLKAFLDELERTGELHRVSRPVSPILEIAEIADRQSKSRAARLSEYARAFDPDHCESGGKALFFENVEGCDFPLCINVYGSYRRTEMALGCDQTSRDRKGADLSPSQREHRSLTVAARQGGFESIAQRIASLVKIQPPRSIGEILAKGREFLPLLRIPPKRVKRGICQEIVKLTSEGEVDLTRLPLIKCWPFDGDPRKVGYDVSPEDAGTAGGDGRYITFAGMHTIHADDEDEARPASHNIGMYRAQLIDATRLAMHWHVHHDGANHWRSWKKRGKPMPIAICLGGESVLPYAATAPLPPGMSELLMAGFLNGRGIPLVCAKTVPLWVPANSEIVIEGWVSTECGEIGWDPRSGEPLGPSAVFEGPFGDHTGYYSMPDRYPIVEVSAITHRRDAVYPTTIVGLPPQEDYYLGKATERIFLPLLKTIIHDIEDYHLPMFGCFHNCAFIRIKKQYALQARRVMHAVWGAGQMAWTKMIVVVDEDVNVHDEEAVLRAMFQNCDFGRDIEIVNGPLDILDHAAPRLGAGHKIGFDATRKIPGGGEEVTMIARAQGDSASKPRDCNPWASAPIQTHAPAFSDNRLLLARIEKQNPRDGGRAIESLLNDPQYETADFIIVVDHAPHATDLANWREVFFRLCANADPGRDIVRRGSRIAFDATKKLPGDEQNGQPVRDYPPIIEMCSEVKGRIDEHATAFGL